MQTSQGVAQSHIRDEVTKIQQENLKFRIQTEHAQAEITRLGVLTGERDTVIMKQKQLIGELEKSKTDEGILPDHNYISRTESDLIMDALQRQLLIEFESQQASSSRFLRRRVSCQHAVLRWRMGKTT